MNGNGKELRNRLRDAMTKIDDLETQLDGISKQKAMNDKQIEIQKNVIQELRKSRDESVEWTEYEVLKEDFEKNYIQLTQTEERVEQLSKKLVTDSTEIESLHKKCSQQTDQISDLEKSLNECLHTINSQNEIIVEINDYKEKQEFYRKQFESSLDENKELKELLQIYRNEDMNDSKHLNISVDDLNQSMGKFLESHDCNANEETFDSVFDIKLADIQKTVDLKKRVNDELEEKTRQMEEEINKLVQLRDALTREVEDSHVVEKQSFDRVFKVVENHVLSRMPFNGLLVPITRTVLFTLMPKCLLRALPK